MTEHYEQETSGRSIEELLGDLDGPSSQPIPTPGSSIHLSTPALSVPSLAFQIHGSPPSAALAESFAADGTGSQTAEIRSQVDESYRPPTTNEVETLTETEVDKLIRGVQEHENLCRKRNYLEAYRQGIIPAFDPFEHDRQQTSSRGEPASKKAKHHHPALSAMRGQMKGVEYKGGSWSDMNSFLFKLKQYFALGDFDDETKCALAGVCLKGNIDRQWTAHVSQSFNAICDGMTWEYMESWIRNYNVDRRSRVYDVCHKLRRFAQRDNQRFDNYFESFQATVAELPYELPESFVAAYACTGLKPELQTQVTNRGIPQTKKELISSAKTGESTLSNQQGLYHRPTPRGVPPQKSAEQKQTETRDENPRAGPPPSQRSRAPPRCYSCGEEGHIQPNCPKLTCARCYNKGHIARNCPTAAGQPTNPNNIPLNSPAHYKNETKRKLVVNWSSQILQEAAAKPHTGMDRCRMC